MQPGGPRRVALGGIAVITLLAGLGGTGGQESEPVAVATDGVTDEALPFAETDPTAEAEPSTAPEATTLTTALTSVAPSTETQVVSTAAPTTVEPTTVASTTAESTTTTIQTTTTESTTTTSITTTTAPPTTAATTTIEETTTTPGCHPAYVECIAHHPGDALNCGDIRHVVHLHDPNNDPYNLDGSGSSVDDGVGCESYG